jgi:hypothetical protein
MALAAAAGLVAAQNKCDAQKYVPTFSLPGFAYRDVVKPGSLSVSPMILPKRYPTTQPRIEPPY